MPTPDPHATRRVSAMFAAPLLTALVLLPMPFVASAQDTREIGERDPGGPAPVAENVEPIGDWLRLRDIVWREEQIGIHIRTGYARPIVFPEPVRLAEAVTLPGCDIDIDADVTTFSPRESFAAQVVGFVGEDSGRVYLFRIRASAEGKRVPIRMVLP